jgi:hypothetical protein
MPGAPINGVPFPPNPGPVKKPDDSYGLISMGCNVYPQKLTTALKQYQHSPERSRQTNRMALRQSLGSLKVPPSPGASQYSPSAKIRAGDAINARTMNVGATLERAISDPTLGSLPGFTDMPRELRNDPRFRFLNPRRLPQLGMVPGVCISGAPCSVGPMADECMKASKEYMKYLHPNGRFPGANTNWAPSYWPSWWPPVAGGEYINEPPLI